MKLTDALSRKRRTIWSSSARENVAMGMRIGTVQRLYVLWLCFPFSERAFCTRMFIYAQQNWIVSSFGRT